MGTRGNRILFIALIGLISVLGVVVLWRVTTWLFRAAPWFALVALLLTALVLVLLVLIQRGKGGGLAGAFGGMGGQSAFGTKAGDTFTRITIGVAAAWIFLCIVSVRALQTDPGRLNVGSGSAPAQQGAGDPASGDEADSSGTSGSPSSEGTVPSSSGDSSDDPGLPAERTDSGGS